MRDGRSWLPIYFAIGLFVQNKISAEDVHMLRATNVLAMYHLSNREFRDQKVALIEYAPAHLLCIQKEANMSIVRYYCLRDPKAFLYCPS
jgi:hypothetical protein